MTAVVSVVLKRRGFLAGQCGAISAEPNVGRLLVYEPIQSVSDGGSQYSSAGFFDQDDAPPPETWVLYLDGKLYAWVPACVNTLADHGVDTNPVNCIEWVGDCKESV